MSAAEQIAARFPNFGFFLVGDYNLPAVAWHLNDDIFYDTRNSRSLDTVDKATILGDRVIAMGLWQCHPVLVPNKDYTLDLAFTNICNAKFATTSEILSTVDPHHPPALFKFTIRMACLRKFHIHIGTNDGLTISHQQGTQLNQ